jgi:hypothetical protein
LIRKCILALILALSATLLLAAMDQTFIGGLKFNRYYDHLEVRQQDLNSWYHQLLIRSDKWRYGDLYGLCYLPEYKFKLERFKKYPRISSKPVTNRILYIIGDSFLADKTLTGAFDGFDDVKFLDRRFPFGPIVLDSTKQNYMVMEFSEWGLIGYDINKTNQTMWNKDDLKARANFQLTAAPKPTVYNLPGTLWDRLNNTIFNKNLSRNLETLLFDDKLFTPAKELKADINYKLFNRVDKGVAISTDKKRLLVNATVDTTSSLSDFRNISNKEIGALINNLDAANNYYRSIGFKKVILTIIPNAVSIYDENRMHYNRLLERVEQDNHFMVVDIYKEFKDAPINLYYRSDTHWNPQGLDLWVKTMNKSIKTW